MKKFLDRFVLFLLKIFFISSVGILILRFLNAVSFKVANSHFISWKWLNSLFTNTEILGALIALGAIISGVSYLFWLWWDPFLVRLPHQKGSPYLYYEWEEGLESSTTSDSEKNLKKI